MSTKPQPRKPERPPASSAKPLVSTKLVPPRSAGRVVAREALLARLMEGRRRRCVVLQGPAGCGKTTTLVAWRQALLPLGFDVAWLTLTPEDNEPSRLLDYLLASVAQVAPAATQEAAAYAGRGVDSEAMERALIALVRGIAAHPRELVLVLDDLHHLTDPRIHEALQWLLDYAPANLHYRHRLARGAAAVARAPARRGPVAGNRRARPALLAGRIRALPARATRQHRAARRAGAA